MDFAYSPGRIAGGTLHLSPSHLQHVDSPMSRSLRRSLSRSPSKAQLARSPTPQRPAFNNSPSASTSTNPRHQASNDDFQLPSAKKARPTLRRTSPLTSISQCSTPARSTMQRALSDSSDNGNGTPQSSGHSADGQENLFPSSPESAPEVHEPSPEETSPPKSLPSPKPPRLTRAPLFRPNNREWRPIKSSPLKRSDAVMNLALDPPGSPSAKRRTICGGIVSSPFSAMRMIWDQEPSDREPTSSDEESLSQDAPFRSSLAPRLHTIRRSKGGPVKPSEKPSATRRSLETARESPRRSRPSSKTRVRLPANTSALSSGSEDDGTSFEPNDLPKVQFARPMRAQPHPLSQALSPTSPTPPRRDENFDRGGPLFDSPTIPALDFSKSLPIGALRPSAEDRRAGQTECQQSSFESSFATPKLYHIAKPDPAAFRSTGLISKKHRNPDDIPPPPPGYLDMPDTPCKRFPGGFTFSTSPTPTNSAAKEQRFSKPAFGTPSKPFNPHGTRPSSGSLGQSVDIFGTNFNHKGSSRRASIVSFEGDEYSQSPQCPTESQSSADELPPTPTKQVFGTSNTKPNSLRSSIFGRRPSLGPATFVSPEAAEPQLSLQTESSCKFTFLATRSRHKKQDAGSSGMLSEPTVSSAKSSKHPPMPLVPAQLLRKRLRGSSAASSISKTSGRSSSTKTSSRNTVFQPLPVSSADRGVPETPIDNAMPDPSGLSISPGWKQSVSPAATRNFPKSVSCTPATPTHREGIAPLNFNRPISTPSNHVFGHDIDPVLSSRFTKVEWYGKGQFSDVYKVFERRSPTVVQGYFASSSGSRSSQAFMPDKVYIVKKSKLPYTSMKIRQRKLREAAVMATLGKSDHVVHLINSWEASGHLYIQTEFCEEGSLEQFLAKAGNKGRLDDFRIWKILIELGEGLKRIHDSGFIHLDLKPANVFIDFAGVLKIGDFGLASEWPAPANVEGEGDRRYIGPDLLQGSFDKPADIFALGMMMFEIAGNCELPDNGTYWQHLRSGNWSDLPSLTSASSHGTLRDSQDDLATSGSLQTFGDCKSNESLFPYETTETRTWKESFESCSPSILVEEVPHPPRFMQDPQHPEALEQIVHWMMQPKAVDRPVIDQILGAGGCRWVDERRRAGAVVFEGAWGPSSPVLTCQEVEHEDHEMLDAP